MKVMEFFTVRLAQLTFHKVTCTNIQSRLHCPSAYAAGTACGTPAAGKSHVDGSYSQADPCLLVEVLS